MPFLPSAAKGLFMSFSVAFCEPTAQRMTLLCIGAILTASRRTVTSMLRIMQSVRQGHFTSYHRVFSRASWSLWPLGRILAAAIFKWIPEDQPLIVVIDDTTAQHRGKKVYGKGCHHDAVRSTHKHIVFKWGHKWVVLAITVKFPFASRAWALPVLVALYRPEELNRAENRQHKTPPHLARQLMAVLIRWFPGRKYVFLGDGGYSSHALARFCSGHAALVSRFHGDANLYALPPKRRGKIGRPRIKGRKLPTPESVVARNELCETTVDWYGGRSRRVGYLTSTGHWYKSGHGLVEVRWVYVHDLGGTHRDEYFYTTDVTLAAEEVIGLYTRRWSLEVTFQEVRAHLGFETTRQWVAKSVLRTGPLLLGLFSVVCLIFSEHVRTHKVCVAQQPWYSKTEPTFSDALATVRRLFWSETIFEQSRKHWGFQKLPPKLREMLLDHLSLAA